MFPVAISQLVTALGLLLHLHIQLYFGWPKPPSESSLGLSYIMLSVILLHRTASLWFFFPLVPIGGAAAAAMVLLWPYYKYVALLHYESFALGTCTRSYH